MKFNEFAKQCYEASKAKGFYDKPPTVQEVNAAEQFLTVIYEASKLFEHFRNYKYEPDDNSYFSSSDHSAHGLATVKTALLATEVAEMAEHILKSCHLNTTIFEGGKREGYVPEAVDVLIRLGDQFGKLIAEKGLDFDAEVEAKLEYNKKRPYKNGKNF